MATAHVGKQGATKNGKPCFPFGKFNHKTQKFLTGPRFSYVLFTKPLRIERLRLPAAPMEELWFWAEPEGQAGQSPLQGVFP